MAKKDKKSKTAEQKARVAAKQSKKLAQKEKKARTKAADDSDADDIDIESILEKYQQEQAQFVAVTEVISEPPSARGSATFIASPSSTNELLLFGGEHWSGEYATFYNDLFTYRADTDVWKKVTSKNSPLPRSGHAWCRGGNAGGIYLFGGEFSSPKQGTFYHYNDFWRLDPSSREWTRLDTRGKTPAARSGHRMTYFKQYIILFGGFQDTAQQTRYLQDLWLYDCNNFTWYNPPLSAVSQKPDARSSFSFHPHDNGAVLTGGYSRKAFTSNKKPGKGSSNTPKAVLAPFVHEDSWFLRITVTTNDAASAPVVRWEKRKKPANTPNPARAGVTQVYHRGRGIFFGGVHDVEDSEEAIESEFFNELFAWNIERNRYFPLSLRRARTVRKKQPEPKRARGKADEEDLLRNLAALEQSLNPDLHEENDVQLMEEDDETAQPEKPILNEMPHRRYRAHLAVQGDILYILGGTYEKGEREYTFDEMHSIDLRQLDGVRELFKREIEGWGANEASESDSDTDEEGSDDEGVAEEDTPKLDWKQDGTTPMDVDETQAEEEGEEEEEEESESAVEQPSQDGKPQPRPFENLREFFSRTTTEWQQSVIQNLPSEVQAAQMSVKEVRKLAFEAAEHRWWDCREEIAVLEEEQEAAGIGEVVNLAERTKESGGGRRR